MAAKHKQQDLIEAKIPRENPLYEVVQDGYRLFKQGRTEHAICDCCMSAKARKEFFSLSQSELPLKHLNQWFDAAADAPMPKAAWRFVMPRIMEVLASGEDSSRIGPEVALNRFDTGNPEHWTTEEWNTLDRFQRLLLNNINLRNDDCLDDIVCIFANADWNVDDLFAQVLALPTELLVNTLWSDWCEYHHPSIGYLHFGATKARLGNFTARTNYSKK